MNLVLQMTRGPMHGTRRVLQPGQRAVIGSSNWSDFPSRDVTMEDHQFLVKCLRTAGWVRNLSASASLMVNGVVVQSRRLGDGDIISAGGCDLIAGIRDRRKLFEGLTLPLAGSQEFSEQFDRRFVAPRVSSVGVVADRGTVFPGVWGESIQAQSEGIGIPPLSVLQEVARNASAGLLIDAAAAPGLFAAGTGVRPEQIIPVSSPDDQRCFLFLLEQTPLELLHVVLSRLWMDGQVIFFVPADETLRHRNRFTESSLWQGRTAGQVSSLLTDGPVVLREGIFRYLESVILPTEGGWTVLSGVALNQELLHRSSA